MRRLQLIEIHEQPWCPPAIRDGATDCLRVLATIGRQYRNVVPLLVKVLSEVHTEHIIDLCSGGGGPWPTLSKRINQQTNCFATLTDLYPSLMVEPNLEDHPFVRAYSQPVDATAVPSELEGVRTLFTALHHFPPEIAENILADAVEQGQAIAIFEQTRRVWWALPIILATLPIALLVTPFLKPFRWSRLFWTYLIPAIPLVLCVDGIVSCLRTYTLDEMRQFVLEVDPQRCYCWQIGRLKSPLSPIGVQYLVGYPSASQMM